MIKLGRALQAGETRIKLYLLRPNVDEVRCLFIFNFVFIEDSLIQKNKNFDPLRWVDRACGCPPRLMH